MKYFCKYSFVFLIMEFDIVNWILFTIHIHIYKNNYLDINISMLIFTLNIEEKNSIIAFAQNKINQYCKNNICLPLRL